MAKLAILGHATRGKEVIEILEMLGGKNDKNLKGSFLNSIYFINNHGYIESCDMLQHLDYLQLTLEEFEKKYPYRISDKVIIKRNNQEAIIDRVIWCFGEIIYWLNYYSNLSGNYRADELQPYKKETMEENLEQITISIPNGYEFSKIKDDNKIILLKKQLIKYPKTYKECCGVLLIPPYYNLRYHTYEHGYNEYTASNTLLSLEDKLNTLGKLLICRDAYWKIAGEETGFGKPWEPDYDSGVNKYGIICMNGVVQESNPTTNWERHLNKVLDFPTKEMRDEFYNNFKDLIEKCKELL